MQILVNYDFPGNIRELENAVEYAIAFSRGDVIGKEDLPDYLLNDRKAVREARSSTSMPLREAKSSLRRKSLSPH